MSDQRKSLADFLYEASSLSRTPRSFTYFYFWGGEHQSVADHICRMMFIVYVLAQMDGSVDVAKCMKMCLFHDLAEARTGDLNYVNQPYVTADEEQVMDDMTAALPFRDDILALHHEYHDRQSREAILVKEADNLEWILTSKERADQGDARSASAVEGSFARLKTDVGKELYELIVSTNSWDWWANISRQHHYRRLSQDEK